MISSRRLLVFAVAVMAALPATAGAASSPAAGRAVGTPAKAQRPLVVAPKPGDPICPECHRTY